MPSKRRAGAREPRRTEGRVLTKVGQHSGNSILPYKGPNGTWRRPIVIECVGNVAKLQPQGQTFSMLELSPLISPRSSPVVLAIAREMLRIDRAGTPDGAPVVPYLVFMVRPNGIRPYYEVRARLEPLGIAFGYELVEQDLAVDIPNYDDLTTWDGTTPLEMPDIAAATAKPRIGWPSTAATDSRGRNRTRASAVLPPEDPAMAGDSATSGAWPSSRDGGGTAGPGSSAGSRNMASGGRPGSGPDAAGIEPGQMPGDRPTAEIALGGNPGRTNRSDGAGGPGSDDGSPEDFVWPSHSRNGGSRGNSGSNPAGPGAGRDAGMGDGSGSIPNASGSLSSPAFGPGGQGSADGPPPVGSLPYTPSGGAGSATGTGMGTADTGIGRPGRFTSSSTDSMAGGRGGLVSGTGGSPPSSGGRPGSSPYQGGSYAEVRWDRSPAAAPGDFPGSGSNSGFGFGTSRNQPWPRRS